ncbi:MAG: type II toxin-antitoxin system prevent-host-death family antitoxin [Promicromonosporaceae bacterium]|nr:type II toxin-antitoxin system prevent-host-death family antitoxin [Promicromonosporaceae bacterium]
MAILEYGVRALRNHTPEVIAAVENSDTVFLTKHGRRIAQIVPVETAVDTLLRKARELTAVETGWTSELAQAKAADIAAQVDRWA